MENRLDQEGITGYHKERALRDPQKAGAIWKIFHPSDNQKIREAIIQWKCEKACEVVFYSDRTMNFLSFQSPKKSQSRKKSTEREFMIVESVNSSRNQDLLLLAFVAHFLHSLVSYVFELLLTE